MGVKDSNTTCSGMNWNSMLGLLHELKKDSLYRDYLFIATGCYMGLRISDLLTLRWVDVIDQTELMIIEQKTKKQRRITINEQLKKVYDSFISANDVHVNDYLFSNRWGQPITVQYANRRLHKVFKRYNIKTMNGSSHTLRKTFGKRVWDMDNKSERSLIYLSEIFGHANIATTKRYIGIVQKDIEDIYLNL